MTVEYQREDVEGFDYELYPFEGLNLRGPKPVLTDGNYFSCIGAAQAFGRYVDEPYPRQLAKDLGLDCLNLGVGGAGPAMFLNNPGVLDAVNASRFAVVQVLSGRSSSNSMFYAQGAEVRVKLPGLAFASREEKATRMSDDINSRLAAGADPDDLSIPVGTRLHAGQAYEALLAGFDKQYCDVIRQETKLRHALLMIQLLKKITVPKILFYFSERMPDKVVNDYKHVNQYFGNFPQFVDQEFIDLVSPHADAFVQCVSVRGKPHKLSRPLHIKTPKGTLNLVEYNNYYPSPEMQFDAYAALKPAVLGLTGVNLKGA